MRIAESLANVLSIRSSFGYECRQCGLLVADEPTCPECESDDTRLFSPFLGF
ncbi:hypothetical protein ACLI4Y_13290 [Natrialbaceae archaeon A-CW3]